MLLLTTRRTNINLENSFEEYFIKPSKNLFAALLVASVTWSETVHAEDKPQKPAGVMSFDNMADGEVRKVDRENKKMTIKHGELKNLDMPRMTMVFPIRNATLLETFKASDKVKFVANKLDGVFFVTDIQLAK